MALAVKNLHADAGDVRDQGFDPWVRKIFWRRACQSTPVLLPRESHGHRSLGAYGPGSHRVGHSWSDLAYMHSKIICVFFKNSKLIDCPVYLFGNSVSNRLPSSFTLTSLIAVPEKWDSKIYWRSEISKLIRVIRWKHFCAFFQSFKNSELECHLFTWHNVNTQHDNLNKYLKSHFVKFNTLILHKDTEIIPMKGQYSMQ